MKPSHGTGQDSYQTVLGRPALVTPAYPVAPVDRVDLVMTRDNKVSYTISRSSINVISDFLLVILACDSCRHIYDVYSTVVYYSYHNILRFRYLKV